jgi:hypothetical protein
MTPIQLINYYANLLILQYLQKPKAYATIQAIVSQAIFPQTTVQVLTFSAIPTSGNYILNYTPFGGSTQSTTSLAWNSAASAVQTALQALTGLSSVTVTGNTTIGFTVTFTGAVPVVPLLTVTSNTLAAGGKSVTIAVTQTDLTLPLAIQQAFNLVPTIQTLTLSGVPASGTFKITYGGSSTTALSWNASTSAIQTAVQTLVGSNPITITGSLATQSLIIVFQNAPNLNLFTVTSNSLETSGSTAITFAITTNQAVGNQLTTLAKYAGLIRTITLPTGVITLTDVELLALMSFAIVRNAAGSSLSQIQAIIQQFFPGQMLVFDYANMQMSYLISSSLGDQNVVDAVVAQGLLMVPMGVACSVIYAPVINQFFGFRTYELAGYNNSPFNDYSSYNQTWPWLSYADAIVA